MPHLLITIGICVLAAAAVAAVIVILRRKSAARAARMRSAAILLRVLEIERHLKRTVPEPKGRNRQILQLSWKDSSKRSYVFDPSSPIQIGRDTEKNQVSIRQDTVSDVHCRLFIHHGRLVVQDLDSANGTYIRRFTGRQRVEGSAYLKNRDVLEIGGLAIDVRLFLFDAAYV